LVKVSENVSPDTEAEAIGGVSLLGGWGSGQSTEAVPVSVHVTGGD
jgi:hypothetical protein